MDRGQSISCRWDGDRRNFSGMAHLARPLGTSDPPPRFLVLIDPTLQTHAMNRSFLFIPDISGFTKFVNATEVAHSQHVIAELLELIIDSDELGMTVSEVEGDAILFYRAGEPPPLEALVAQAQKTFEAFHTHLKAYEAHRICTCGACRAAPDLTLKIIAHAGPMELISVKGFEKPFGSDVILAHRLLKNDIAATEYLLVTEPLLGTEETARLNGSTPPAMPDWVSIVAGEASYEDLRPVAYRYVPLAPLHGRIPNPPVPPVFEKTDNPIVHTLFIDQPLADVYELISNFDMRLLWNRSVDELRYDEDRVTRVGTRHHCVIGGDLIEFETITSDFGEDRLVYGERIPDNPFVDDFASYYVLESEGTGTCLRLEVHYRSKPFPRNLLAPIFRYRFGRRMPVLLDAIKEEAEARVA